MTLSPFCKSGTANVGINAKATVAAIILIMSL